VVVVSVEFVQAAAAGLAAAATPAMRASCFMSTAFQLLAVFLACTRGRRGGQRSALLTAHQIHALAGGLGGAPARSRQERTGTTRRRCSRTPRPPVTTHIGAHSLQGTLVRAQRQQEPVGVPDVRKWRRHLPRCSGLRGCLPCCAVRCGPRRRPLAYPEAVACSIAGPDGRERPFKAGLRR
jgi:hypothetical protein